MYSVGCTLAPLANTTEPSMCGGNVAVLSNYFDDLFHLTACQKVQVFALSDNNNAIKIS